MTGKTCGHGTFMRPETPANQHECTAHHGPGARVEIRRSRSEFARLLNKYTLSGKSRQGNCKGSQ